MTKRWYDGSDPPGPRAWEKALDAARHDKPGDGLERCPTCGWITEHMLGCPEQDKAH